MSSIEKNVLSALFERVSEGEEVNAVVVDGLRQALMSEKLPKAEQLVQLISDATGEGLT